MSYSVTNDEKATGGFSSIASAYADAPSSFATTYTLAQTIPAYGLFTATGSAADSDAYTMGILLNGTYSVLASNASWFLGTGYSSIVSPSIGIYNSLGNLVASNSVGSVSFSVSTPGTYYAVVSGATDQSSQYALSYTYTPPANDAATSNLTIVGNPSSGNVVSVVGNFSDANGTSTSIPAITWLVDAEVVATENSYTIQSADSGKLLTAIVQFYDDAGYLETLTASPAVRIASSPTSPTYSISPSATSVNEGGSVTYTVTTTNVASGTQLAYTLSGTGMTTADIGGAALTGMATVAANGTASFTVTLTADQLTEGAETLTATVQGQSASAAVNDTSTNSVAAGRTKYFVLPSSAGANFTDFDLSYGALTLAGEQVTFVGSSAVDAVFVRPGITVDFTLSGSSADKIYLAGNFASYTASITGSVMNLQRGSGASFESVSFIKWTSAAYSDSVIFADGTLNSLDLYNKLKTGTPLPALSTTETSIAPLAPALAGSLLNASIKAFALNAGGDTFAPAQPGVAMTVVGSAGVDTVYVPRGGVVDCTLLGSGQDVIYFTGNWGDYTKAIAGIVLTFSRSVDGYSESVRVVGNPANFSLNDQLVFADGAVHSGDAKTALTASLTAAISAVTGYDATLITPGLPPTFSANALNNVTNLEVGSNLVLNYRESVTAMSGKYIHIVNDGGTGFRGENTTNTLDILVTDTTQVSIVAGRVTLNPTADLDLANNYHITIDAGAFTGGSSRQTSAAYDGPSTLHFSTVTPGTSTLANAAASQVINADGTLSSGHLWLDIEGIGSPSASSGTALDLAANHYALVAKDYSSAGGADGYDGVTTGDFYVATSNFGAGDLIYVDNQGGATNDLSQTNIINDGNPPTTVQFAGTGLGGMLDISLAATVATFETIFEMKSLLGNATNPVISA